MRLLLALSAFSAFSVATAETNARGPALMQSAQSSVVQKATAAYTTHHRLHQKRRLEGFSICMFFPTDELAKEGLNCECTDTENSLTLSCEHPGEINEPGYGSISDIEMTVTISFDGMDEVTSSNGEISIEAAVAACATYGEDVVIEELRNDRFCFDMGMSIPMDLTADEADEATLPTLSDCGASLNNVDCGCGICLDGIGIELNCPGTGGALVVKCTDFVDAAEAAGGGGGTGSGMDTASVVGGGLMVQRFEKVDGLDPAAPVGSSGGSSVIPAVAPLAVSVLGYALTFTF